MRQARYGLAPIVGMLCVMGIAGCVASHLAPQPSPATDIAGRWVLDPAASDDARALITKALPVPRKSQSLPVVDPAAVSPSSDTGRQGGGRRGGGRSNGTTAGAPADVAPSWGKVTPRDFISAFAMPAKRVDISAHDGRLIVAADARRREFVPGDETPFSLVDRYGSRRVRAGWSGQAFEVQSDDGARLHVVEDFRHSSGDQLVLQVEFKARGLKSVTVRSVYRRATPSELELPDEGPPPPAPR